jgi:BMFP domain-containing protein YqiC
MNVIEELCTRRDLVPDPRVFTDHQWKTDVFQRVSKELAEGELGREVERAMRKQAEGWSAMANQVVGGEHA